ncbi:AVN_collapsed_G0046680.mRNA.1.CDS.1 [Saccharomyces cerevisiae]|nr:AVN_collapsed_G0046680.mRNA.1.CDS.1 [Saccharomyces cerevisiae]
MQKLLFVFSVNDGLKLTEYTNTSYSSEASLLASRNFLIQKKPCKGADFRKKNIPKTKNKLIHRTLKSTTLLSIPLINTCNQWSRRLFVFPKKKLLQKQKIPSLRVCAKRKGKRVSENKLLKLPL